MQNALQYHYEVAQSNIGLIALLIIIILVVCGIGLITVKKINEEDY